MIYEPAEDSYLLASVLKEEISKIKNKDRTNFLEIGIGSGIQLQTALDTGLKKENILGVDINPEAVRHCTKSGFNCIHSNLFSKIKDRYNIVVFNPPYLPEDKEEDKESKLATTGGKKGNEIIIKFLEQAKNYLAKEGRIYILTSSLTGKIDFKKFGYKEKLVAKKKIFFEELVVWDLTP